MAWHGMAWHGMAWHGGTTFPLECMGQQSILSSSLWPWLQVDLAEELDLPLFMHCRDAWARFFEVLRERRRGVPGVVHCFTGGEEELQTCLAMGLHIGITG
jgi:hypothetical protein